MLLKFKRWLEPPAFDHDKEKTGQVDIANTLILLLFAALLFTIFVLIPVFAIQKTGSWIISGIMLCVLAAGRALIFRGRWRLGIGLIFSTIYLCILALVILSGGSSSRVSFWILGW
jgi:hypothetical protein